jgi:VanZ family protein
MSPLFVSRPMQIVALLAVVGLAVASWTPGEEMIRTGMNGKLEHAIAYLLTCFAFTQGYPDRSPWRFTIALSIYATILEIGQIIVPGRHAAFLDLAAGVVGTSIASMVVVIWRLPNQRTFNGCRRAEP